MYTNEKQTRLSVEPSMENESIFVLKSKNAYLGRRPFFEIYIDDLSRLKQENDIGNN